MALVGGGGGSKAPHFKTSLFIKIEGWNLLLGIQLYQLCSSLALWPVLRTGWEEGGGGGRGGNGGRGERNKLLPLPPLSSLLSLSPTPSEGSAIQLVNHMPIKFQPSILIKKKFKNGGSRNWVMGPTGRPQFKNRCIINTHQGLRNLLMYHLLS